jgi:putative membrane protein
LRNSSNDSKFIQQHLANERTFLAWVRTSLTIIGIGFLAAGLVFRSSPYNHLAHWLTSIVGFGAVILGICILTLATRDFFIKQKGINSDRFQSPTTLIWIIFVSLVIIGVLLIGLIFIMLF